MNFDGYDDVFVLTTWGATGNEAGCVWLYDPQSGRFEFSKRVHQLWRIRRDEETKTLSTRGNGGMGTFRTAKYVVEGNRPVPVISVNQDFNGKTPLCCSAAA
jgi:hypothetical protein